MAGHMEGSWERALQNPATLKVIGWDDPIQIIGIAEIIEPPPVGHSYNLGEASRTLDKKGIQLQTKTQLLKAFITATYPKAVS